MVIYTVLVDGDFYMSAPLSTIETVFGLQSPATARIAELSKDAQVELFFNGRSRIHGVDRITVVRSSN